ncbi:hypothetical protein [Micromonospora sp. URMC 103]|uniref:hypothetical protein n=1 Tax=Micromonospora sp. URMC 103 TaxID=3423406 RepID=UPI003F1B5163
MTRHESGRAEDAPRLVRDAVRDVVGEVAPDELVLVDALRRHDDDTAVRRLSRARRSRDLLGFGLGEATVLVTALVWIALDEVVRTAVGAGMAKAGTGLRGWLRARLGRPAPPRPMPALTAEQLRAVQDRVRELGVAADLTPEAAALLADRVVARLALATADEPAPSGRGRTDEPAPSGRGRADEPAPSGRGGADGPMPSGSDRADGPARSHPDSVEGSAPSGSHDDQR